MEMANSCKRLAVGGDKVDRLSDLPINLAHQIQEKLPIEDSARMIVLSRTWRYVWASNPKLVFDEQFCSKREISHTIDIITTILSQHHGAIKKFLVDMSLVHASHHSVVDQWMLLLSRNGLVDLIIQNRDNVNAPYRLPSYVYGVELAVLDLSNCIIRLPCRFRCLPKLRGLILNQVTIESDNATSPFWLPNLLKLYLCDCDGLQFLNIYAPELLYLYVIGGDAGTLKLGPLMECGKLKTFGIATPKEVSPNSHNEEIKSTDLLSSWPELSCLILDGYFLKLFCGMEAERQPTSLNPLKALRLFNYDFDSEDQNFSLLSIVRRSPNLDKLLFLLCQRKKDIRELDANLFKEANCSTAGLKNLCALQIKRFRGSRTELSFVRFVLASAPILEWAIFQTDKRLPESRSSKISKELMSFPRASPKLEIIYTPWIKQQSRSDV